MFMYKTQTVRNQSGHCAAAVFTSLKDSLPLKAALIVLKEH